MPQILSRHSDTLSLLAIVQSTNSNCVGLGDVHFRRANQSFGRKAFCLLVDLFALPIQGIVCGPSTPGLGFCSGLDIQ
jgi:hypothetical protein